MTNLHHNQNGNAFLVEMCQTKTRKNNQGHGSSTIFDGLFFRTFLKAESRSKSDADKSFSSIPLVCSDSFPEPCENTVRMY